MSWKQEKEVILVGSLVSDFSKADVVPYFLAGSSFSRACCLKGYKNYECAKNCFYLSELGCIN